MHLRGIIAELLVSRSVRLLVRRLPWHLAQLYGSIKPQFRVTRCPTFQRGHVISCLTHDAALSKTNPSGGLKHLHTLGTLFRFYKVDVLWHTRLSPNRVRVSLLYNWMPCFVFNLRSHPYSFQHWLQSFHLEMWPVAMETAFSPTPRQRRVRPLPQSIS